MDVSRRGSTRGRRLARLLCGLTVALMLMAIGGEALARGTVQVARSTVEEDDGEWKLKFTINYGSTPHLAHIPMVFSFKQTAIFERMLTDESGDTPVQRTVPVHNATPINLPMDVGFADMSGKMFKITKFSMKLSREADFEAGEYQLTVKLAAGGVMGRPMKIRLNGKNKAVDRRAMVFGGKVSGKKKEDNKPAAAEKSEDSQPKAAEEYGADLSDIPDISEEEAEAIDDPNAPGKVGPKQGGCGCELPGSAPAGAPLGWLAAGTLLAAVSLRRRRRV